MIYNSAKELVDTELPRTIRAQLYPIFIRGLKAYRDILNMQGGTFQSVFIHNIKGWLLNYMIFRQFEADMLSSAFPFVPEPVKVNSFKYTSLNLRSGNLRLNVGKAFDNNSFPNPSKYRRKSCYRNRFPSDDLFTGTTDPYYDQLFESEAPYYAFLTFNIKNDDMDFLNIMVPNWNMKRCLTYLNLRNELSLVKTEHTEESQNEKIITSLKDGFIKNIPLKGEASE
ncbi:MAG: hypothetical protein ACYCVD_07560 [Desulfitobacteriaceae bacterium]